MRVKYFTNGDINVINTGDNELSKNFGPTYYDGYDCKENLIKVLNAAEEDRG